MSYLMKAGGFSMWVVLLFCIAALGTAVLFARRPKESLLGFFRGLSKATVFTILGGLASNLAATFYNVAHRFADDPDRALIAMLGVSESLSPAILGFSLLGIAWLITAVGVRRLGATGI
jgi:hypothetical protein